MAAAAAKKKWIIIWDLQCPYSRKHWELHTQTLRAAFQDKYDFEVNLTSLAFHAQAFPGQCVAQWINKNQGVEGKLKFVDACFANQDKYMNAALPDPKKSDVLKVFGRIAKDAGLWKDEGLTEDAFVEEVQDWDTVVKPAYMEHKAALFHGAFGAPKHVIEGKLVPDTESAWGEEEWKAKLETL